MTGWLSDLLTSDGFAVFAGAFFGALLGYAANWLHSRQKARARRAALIRVLHRQLEMIPYAPATLAPDSWVSRTTFHISAVSQLLDGETLDARKDAELIRMLSLWQSWETSHNEAVHLARQASMMPGVSPKERDACYSAVDSLHRALREGREYICKLVPPDEMTYGILGSLEDDYLSWGSLRGRWATALRPWHWLDRRRAQRRPLDEWRTSLDEIVANDDAARDAEARKQAGLEAAERAHRERAEETLANVVVPALEQIRDELIKFGRTVDFARRPDSEFNSLNPHRSGHKIASHLSVAVTISHPIGDSFNFFFIAVSTPEGVKVRIAARDPRSPRGQPGWSRDVSGDLDSLDPETAIAAILQHYERYLQGAHRA